VRPRVRRIIADRTPLDSDSVGELRAHGRADRPAVRPPASRPGLAAGAPSGRRCAVWPPVGRLCLECRERLPGYGRTGTPVNDVEDYRLVVD